MNSLDVVPNPRQIDLRSAPCAHELADEALAWVDCKASARAKKAVAARGARPRRRRIDPTTCDRDYSPAELEFAQAIQAYKQTSGRLFPTWSEVLEVLQSLGYRKSE
jgi:hypothetical protein